MTYAELLELAFQARNETLKTVTGRAFRVNIYRDVPFFIPESTGQGRSDGRRAAERFLERFNETGSRKTSDYADVTRNASYLLALIEWGGRPS